MFKLCFSFSISQNYRKTIGTRNWHYGTVFGQEIDIMGERYFMDISILVEDINGLETHL
jgi:hypothetical protein